jgi:hypothetical protein
MLAKLCRQLSAHKHHVIVMSRRLEMADQFRRSGALVHPLGPGLIREFLRLKSLTRETPVRINGWMYHGNLLALAIRTVFFRGSPLVWHVRQSLDNRRAMRPRTRLIARANQVLSSRVPRVLFNSAKAMSDHLGSGWCSTNSSVWYNGFDPAVFELRARSREAFRLRLRAARIHLLGPQADVASWLAAADLFILHSRAESFPNALGEAVFSCCLCVATRVGDADLLLPGGQTQVAPQDARALRKKIEEVLSWPKQKKDRYVSRCFRNAVRRFSLQKSAAEYMMLSG